MSCADGTGCFLGFTVEIDAQGKVAADADDWITETQGIHARTASGAITVATLVKVRSHGEWAPEVTVFDSPRAEDTHGAYMRKRVSCRKSNPPFTASIEYDGNFALELLIGAYGLIRRTNEDGSYREAKGWITRATPMPNQAPDEENLGEITVQWEGGNFTDVGHPVFFDSDGNQDYPVNPA